MMWKKTNRHLWYLYLYYIPQGFVGYSLLHFLLASLFLVHYQRKGSQVMQNRLALPVSD